MLSLCLARHPLLSSCQLSTQHPSLSLSAGCWRGFCTSRLPIGRRSCWVKVNSIASLLGTSSPGFPVKWSWRRVEQGPGLWQRTLLQTQEQQRSTSALPWFNAGAAASVGNSMRSLASTSSTRGHFYPQPPNAWPSQCTVRMCKAPPNPSFKPSPNGVSRGPGRRWEVHFC